jgi:hypothetical protein
MFKPQHPSVEEKEVKRFLKRYLDLHTTVKDIFAELNAIYEQGDVRYMKRCPHTKFNLRHETHPQTNLSEANGLNFMVEDGYQVRYVEDKSQYNGADFEYFKDEAWVSVSVKLCSMSAKCLSVHYTIRDALAGDSSDEVFFIDNRQPSGLLMAMKDIRPLLHSMPTSPYKNTRHLLWFDKPLGKQSTFYGRNNDKNN